MADNDNFDLDEKDGLDETDQDSSPDEDSTDSDNAKAASQPSEDADVIQEWGKLTGTQQDRIRQLVREKNELSNKQETKENPNQDVPPAPNQVINSEAQRAADTLKTKFNFVDKGDMEKELRKLQDSMVITQAHERLESKYDGSDGRPKYDREVVEDHAKKSGVWDLETSYKSMYEDELLDFNIKERAKTKAPYSEGPAKSARKGAPAGLSREDIGKMTPVEYEKNRDKILKLVSQGDL